MEKFFELEYITAAEYVKLANELAERFGAPAINKDIRNDEMTCFRLLNRISYNSFDDLLVSLNEDSRVVRSLWYPRGSMPVREGRKRLEDDPEYIEYLRSESANQKQFRVEVRFGGSHIEDTFEYYNESGLWVLRRMAIHTRYFREYDISLHGPTIHFPHTSLIYAIHDKPV